VCIHESRQKRLPPHIHHFNSIRYGKATRIRHYLYYVSIATHKQSRILQKSAIGI
jgi:hypothetical protein